MSNKFEQPLTVNLKAQPHIALFIWLSHSAALAVLLMPLNLPAVSRWFIALLVLASLAFNVCRQRNRGNPIRHIHWDRQTGWRLTFHDGAECRAQLLADSYVSTWLVVVRLRCEDKKTREVVMTGLSQLPDTLRRLRLRMRYELPSGAAVTDSDVV